MKAKIAVLSAVLLLVTLTGCNNNPQKDKEPEPFSFSESSENTSESDTLPAEEQAQEVEKEPEDTQSTELAEEKDIAEENSNTQGGSEKLNEPTTTPKNEQSAVTGGQEAQKTTPDITPTPTPSVTEAADNSTPEPAVPTVTVQPTSEVTPSEPDFDIDYWISYTKSYAQSVGLTLNSEAIYCWDNPIAAGTKCKYTERDIIACLNRYANNEEITDVWIWAEKTGENAYEIYIGYA